MGRDKSRSQERKRSFTVLPYAPSPGAHTKATQGQAAEARGRGRKAKGEQAPLLWVPGKALGDGRGGLSRLGLASCV